MHIFFKNYIHKKLQSIYHKIINFSFYLLFQNLLYKNESKRFGQLQTRYCVAFNTRINPWLHISFPPNSQRNCSVIRALGLRVQFLPISVSFRVEVYVCRWYIGRSFTRAKGWTSPNVAPRVAGQHRIPSNASEGGRIACRGELSAQLEGARFSLSPSAGRGGCREGFATLEAKGLRARLYIGLAPARLSPLPSSHVSQPPLALSPSPPYYSALVRLCRALIYVYIDT